jgi:ParB family chromosome partitioning protein
MSLKLREYGIRSNRNGDQKMKAEQIQHLPINSLTLGTNVRQQIDEQAIDGLASTIREFGVQQPIRVRREGDKLVVVYGHRRVLAARRAGLTTIPVIIEDRELSSGEVTVRQLLENFQRANLSPGDKAYGIRELMEQTEWTVSEVGKKLGISVSSVSKLLALLSLPSETFAKVQAGSIPASTAYEIAKVADPAKQAELGQQVADGQLTRDKTTELVKREASVAVPMEEVPLKQAKAVLGGGREVNVRGPSLIMKNFICWLKELHAMAWKYREMELKAFLKMVKEQSKAQ